MITYLSMNTHDVRRGACHCTCTCICAHVWQRHNGNHGMHGTHILVTCAAMRDDRSSWVNNNWKDDRQCTEQCHLCERNMRKQWPSSNGIWEDSKYKLPTYQSRELVQ